MLALDNLVHDFLRDIIGVKVFFVKDFPKARASFLTLSRIASAVAARYMAPASS